MDPLKRSLNPKSIAVVGGREAKRVIQQCQKLGFRGAIWAVHPSRDSLAGVPCFQAVQDLPGIPDVAFVAIPAESTIEIIKQLSEMGAGGAICYASGFREVGESDLHQRLLDAAGNMPIIGPNCYGFINTLCGAALWPDQHGMTLVSKGVAIFSSSGNVSINMTMQQRSLAIALVITVGNQAAVGIEECIEAVLDDDRITAIGIHVEGLKNLPLFTDLAVRSAQKGKPIIVLKSGRSAIGARITMSHTATLAGEAGLYDEYFNRVGVGQVDNLEAFLEALKLVSIAGPLKGSRIASMSCSGGEASLIADLAGEFDLTFPALEESHKQSVRATLNEFVNVDNPLDYHTFIWGDQQRTEATFTSMLLGNFDLTLLILDYPCVNQCDMQEWIETGESFANACEKTGQRGAVVCSLPENIPESVRINLIARGITPLLGLSPALGAIQAASVVCRIEQPVPLAGNFDSEQINSPRSLSEFAAKQALAEYGLPLVPGSVVSTADEAVQLADAIGYPVVLKASGVNIAHKSELDAVKLNLTDSTEVKQCARRLLEIGEGLLVEKMIKDGVAELFVGVNFDNLFGHYLVIGFGGTLVELIADRQIVLLPASDEQIIQAIMRLKTSEILHGFRGRPGADIAAVIKSVQQLSAYVRDNRERLLEIDINPLIVAADGAGVTVADALIVNRQ